MYLDINRGKPCLVNLMLSKLFLTGSFYVCSANFILIRFNLIFFRKCLTSINPNIMSFNLESSKCHALKFCSQINQSEQLLFCLLLFALPNKTENKSNFLSFSFNQNIEWLIFLSCQTIDC